MMLLRNSLLSILTFSIYLSTCSAFYFLSTGNEPRCFQKELSKGTVLQGSYVLQVWDDKQKAYVNLPKHDNRRPAIVIDVEEIFDNNERVVHQSAGPQGDFTFVALESGDHRICFRAQTPNRSKNKIDVELHVGSEKELDSQKKATMASLHGRVNNLISKVMEIRREQGLMRDREAQFRDLSEKVNSRAMWLTILQLVALVVTCVWQMKHLSTFFVKQKVL